MSANAAIFLVSILYCGCGRNSQQHNNSAAADRLSPSTGVDHTSHESGVSSPRVDIRRSSSPAASIAQFGIQLGWRDGHELFRAISRGDVTAVKDLSGVVVRDREKWSDKELLSAAERLVGDLPHASVFEPDRVEFQSTPVGFPIVEVVLQTHGLEFVLWRDFGAPYGILQSGRHYIYLKDWPRSEIESAK